MSSIKRNLIGGFAAGLALVAPFVVFATPAHADSNDMSIGNRSSSYTGVIVHGTNSAGTIVAPAVIAQPGRSVKGNIGGDDDCAVYVPNNAKLSIVHTSAALPPISLPAITNRSGSGRDYIFERGADCNFGKFTFTLVRV